MHLFKDKKAITDFAALFSDNASVSIVKDATDIIQTQDPVLAAGYAIKQRIQENIATILGRMLRSFKMAALFCILVVIARIIAAFMTNSTLGNPLGTWTVIWESSKWTVPILIAFWVGYAMYKYGGVTAELVVMIREGLLAISMTYDNLFTQRDLRQVLLNHTLEVKHEEAITNKGHLDVHFNTLISHTCADIERTGMGSAVIFDSVKKYAAYLLKQYNTVSNLDTNYLKTKAPDDKI